MALTTANYRESTLNQSWYNSTFRSTYDLELSPQTFGEVLDRYDAGLGLTSFLNLAGRTMGVRNKTITIFEKGAPTRPVKISIATDAAPVTTTAVTVASDDDSDDYVRAGFDLLIPGSFTDSDLEVVPMRLTYDSGWKGTFYNTGISITTALTTEYVAVGASAAGYGSAGVDPMSTGTYSRTTSDRILKDAVGIEGGVLFNEEYKEFAAKDGGRGIWTRSIGEMDFRLDDQIDSFLLTGMANGNASMTAVSIDGETKAVPSADGLLTIMSSLAQELSWDANGFDETKFRAVKVLLENVGVVNKNVDFFVGSGLNASIESKMIDFLKTNAGGTKYWDEIGKVGFMVNAMKLNGVSFNIAELSALANPNKFGIAAYNLQKAGFMFTQGQYSARMEDAGTEQNLRLPHLTLGYPMGNGENRQRIFMPEPGVNGIQGLGNIAVNSYDGIKLHTLAHVIPIWNHMYKTIKVTYDDSVDLGA